jgi:hypothetical protein
MARLHQPFTNGVQRSSCGGSNFGALMSALGQKQTSSQAGLMSALPPKADIPQRRLDVRFVPIADIDPFPATLVR